MQQSTLVQTSRNYGSLLDRMRSFMAEQHLKVGDRLPSERSLATIFGVSRNSIRTAIRSLAEKGVLESRQGDGTYLCKSVDAELESAILSAVDSECVVFDEVIEFRRIVEPAIARLAARRRSFEQLNALKVIVCDQQSKLLLEEHDGNLDAQFHLALAQCTSNKLLVNTIRHLNEAYSVGRADDLRSLEWRQFSVRSHLRIIHAVEIQDEDACEAEILSHLNVVADSHPFASTNLGEVQ